MAGIMRDARGKVTALNGYEWGDRIEYKYLGDWFPGVITDFDEQDAVSPYYVSTNEYPGAGWCNADDVRKAPRDTAPAPAETRQLQYRIDRTSGAVQGRNAGTWQNIEVGASSVTAVNIAIPPCANYQRISLRQMIPHTDEEILAELRKLGQFALSQHAQDILAGKF